MIDDSSLNQDLLSEKLKLEVGPFWLFIKYQSFFLICSKSPKSLCVKITLFFDWIFQLKRGLVYHFKMFRDPSFVQKVPNHVHSYSLWQNNFIFTKSTFDWLFQLRMGLVCHFKMLKTMLLEKLKLEVGPLLTIH